MPVGKKGSQRIFRLLGSRHLYSMIQSAARAQRISPADHKIVSGSIAVIFVRNTTVPPEGEYELMQIICQHHAHQYGGKQRQWSAQRGARACSDFPRDAETRTARTGTKSMGM